MEDVKDADGWLERTGRSAVFFCRFVPIIRSLISIPAGMAKMELLPFLLLTTAGSLIWNTVLIGAGAVAGASWERILVLLKTYSRFAVMGAGIYSFKQKYIVSFFTSSRAVLSITSCSRYGRRWRS